MLSVWATAGESIRTFSSVFVPTAYLCVVSKHMCAFIPTYVNLYHKPFIMELTGTRFLLAAEKRQKNVKHFSLNFNAFPSALSQAHFLNGKC